jgi:hypothetical protein
MHELKLNEVQKALLLGLNKYDVRYLVIGGHALRANGVTRDTHDLDIWVSNSKGNARKLAMLFKKVKPIPPQGGTWESVLKNKDWRLAYPDDDATKQADLLMSIDGMSFGGCLERAIPAIVEKQHRALVLAYEDLLHSKEISMVSGNDQAAHARDKNDIELLRAAKASVQFISQK